MASDVLGRELTQPEQQLLEMYNEAKRLLASGDFPPAVRKNLGVALAALWNATNDLQLQFEQLYDLGV